MCGNTQCRFQSGIYREKCDFYIPKITIEKIIKCTDIAEDYYWLGIRIRKNISETNNGNSKSKS